MSVAQQYLVLRPQPFEQAGLLSLVERSASARRARQRMRQQRSMRSVRRRAR